jgi:hypothetical protein
MSSKRITPSQTFGNITSRLNLTLNRIHQGEAWATHKKTQKRRSYDSNMPSKMYTNRSKIKLR